MVVCLVQRFLDELKESNPLNVMFAVLDPEGVHGVRSNHPLRLPFLNILTNLVSVRPNDFIFMEYLREIDKISKAKPHTFIYTYEPLFRNPGSVPGLITSALANHYG